MSRNMKDSGVEWIGEIPEEIQLISNKYLLSFVKGKNPENINAEKIGRPYIGASDLEKNGGFHNYENYCDEDLPLASKEDTLILWDGARAGLIGTGHEGYISSTIIKVVPRANYINKKFWYWYLKGFQPVMNEWVGGTTIPHMNRKYIHNIYFLKFPINHQQRMADFLDKKVTDIDHIITKTQASIEEYKRYKQSIITEAVTKGLDPNVPMKDSGIEWIGEIPEHWEVIKLKHLGNTRSGLSNKKPEDFGFGFPFITYKNIYNNYALDETFTDLVNSTDEDRNKCNVMRGDAFFTGSSETIEELGLSSVCLNTIKSATFNGFCIRFRPSNLDKLLPEYIMYYFRSQATREHLIRNDNSITRANLSQKILGSLKVIIPPLSEQKKLAKYLSNVSGIIQQTLDNKQNLINNLESYKKSLIYEVVTGKKEVI